MNWFDLFVLFPVGFIFPSFKMYVAVARQKQVDIFLKHFVVMSVVISITQIVDSVFGSFWLLQVAKIALLWLLLSNDFYGSQIVFDTVIRTIIQLAPFLVEFGYKAHSSSLTQLSQDLSVHLKAAFVQRYKEILSEIDE